jgi:hypothetical protein
VSDIEEHIRRAIESGKFDDLPGKGKPLNLDDDQWVDSDWRLAHHTLKSAGYTLPWIEMLKEIDLEIEAARLALRRAWEWRSASWPVTLLLRKPASVSASADAGIARSREIGARRPMLSIGVRKPITNGSGQCRRLENRLPGSISASSI